MGDDERKLVVELCAEIFGGVGVCGGMSIFLDDLIE